MYWHYRLYPVDGRCRKRRYQLRSGIVYIFAIVMLALMTVMTVALASSTNLNLSRSRHMEDSISAQLSAESGLQFMLMNLSRLRMPASTSSSTFIANLSTEIAGMLNDTPNACGQVVSCSGSTISIPSITADASSFTCSITILTPAADGIPRCRLTSVGSRGLASRTVSLDMAMVPVSADAFNYAIASKGSIAVSGSATIDGMTSPDEANVLSISQDAFAISVGGSATIGGDLFLTADGEDSVYLQGGGLSVGGESDIEAIVNGHVHRLPEEPDFPVLDLAPFAAMATTVIDSTTDLTGPGLVVNNARIAAGTNPEFKQDTVINGILYIESPNVVTFKSKAVLNAMIVTEDVAGDADSNVLDFKGQITAPGVEALPDTSEFQAIKEQQGTVILAPSFSVQFRGSVNSINGTIAADQFSFLGNSNISGEVAGTIIGLSSRDLVMQGNATILVNKQDSDQTPAGFVHFKGVDVIVNSYAEGN
jgi:Tfp pilus assembly protein PilX